MTLPHDATLALAAALRGYDKFFDEELEIIVCEQVNSMDVFRTAGFTEHSSRQ